MLALLTACTSPDLLDQLDQLASEHDLTRGLIHSGDFTLARLSKKLPQQVPHLRVYIGSDGQPWQGREPATDPTGGRSLAAELMVQDPLPALYLGRPCYHGNAIVPPCDPNLWTAGRYSELVVATMTQALDEMIRTYGVEQLTLVGYSGGGTIALLVAASLEPSIKLIVITAASNLDIEQWTRFHQHLPLSHSLNPIDEVTSPASFRQIHLVGRADRVVPPGTIQRYLRTHPKATVWYIDDFDHVCCWSQQWPDLLQRLDAAI